MADQKHLKVGKTVVDKKPIINNLIRLLYYYIKLTSIQSINFNRSILKYHSIYQITIKETHCCEDLKICAVRNTYLKIHHGV